MTAERHLNNAQRRVHARRRRMDDETYVRLRNQRGFVYRMPLRYLAPATSPL